MHHVVICLAFALAVVGTAACRDPTPRPPPGTLPPAAEPAVHDEAKVRSSPEPRAPEPG